MIHHWHQFHALQLRNGFQAEPQRDYLIHTIQLSHESWTTIVVGLFERLQTSDSVDEAIRTIIIETIENW